MLSISILALLLTTPSGGPFGGPLGTGEEAKLLASDGVPFHSFGSAVALHADTVLVGARGDNNSGSGTGAAYVFVRSGTTWVEQAKLIASDGFGGDGFGFSVALHGDTALVGAPYNDELEQDSGAAYVFVRSGTNWTEQAKLRAAGLSFSANAGHSVSIQGDTAVLGAWRAQTNFASTGAAFVFVRSGTSWAQQAELVPNNVGIWDYFGWSVSIDGDTLLASALNGGSGGVAYVFTRSASTWSEQAMLAPADVTTADQFGHSVSLSAGSALIASPRDDDKGFDSGSAYVFVQNGTTWSEQDKLTAQDGSAFDLFGFSVSLAGDTALVGSSRDDPSGADSGAAYAFVRSGLQWTETAKLLPTDGAAGDRHGWSVALDAGRAAISSNFDDDKGQDSGSVYVRRFSPLPQVYCTAKLNSCGTLPQIASTGVPSASASSGFVVTASNARGNRSGLLIYSDSGRAAVPFQGGQLCLANPLRRAPAVNSGGTPGLCDGSFSLDMNCFAAGNCGGNPQPFLLTMGTVVHAQWWGRDSIGNGSYLSDGLEYCVGL